MTMLDHPLERRRNPRRIRLLIAWGAALALGTGSTLPAGAQTVAGLRELGFSFQLAKATKLTKAESPEREFSLVSFRSSFPLDHFRHILGDDRTRLLLEPNVGYFLLPGPAFLGGINIMFRTHLWTRGRLLPFVGWGGGVLYTDFDGLDSKFDFTLLAATGADYFLSRHMSLQVEYRLHHISNGGIRLPNVGINSNFGSIGFSWYY